MRVVLDTNVIISGFLWSGSPAIIMRKIERNELVLILSLDIIDEIDRTLSKDEIKLHIERTAKSVKLLINKICSISRIVLPNVKIGFVNL